MMLCQHEETAVQIAHGYAKASGQPMVAILHDLVGLLHANMAIYYAYIDRAPIFIIGATGPMDETKRRPRIDWIHTAQGQGEAVRAYTKWDYQPHTIAGVPEAFARAYAVMMSEPKGPIYMCYDAWLQEKKLDHEVPLPPPHAAKVPSRIAPDPKALAAAADLIASAKTPVIIAEFVGRDPDGHRAPQGPRGERQEVRRGSEGAQGADRQAKRREARALSEGSARALGGEPDRAAAARRRGVGRDQERGLGAHCRHARRMGAHALGFRRALPASRKVARHRDAVRHLSGRRPRAPRQEASGGGPAA